MSQESQEAPAKEKFWEKLGKLSPDELSDIKVEVERIFPDTDVKTGFPIDGYCGTLKAGGLTKDAIHQMVRGGTYRLVAKHVQNNKFFCSTVVKLPGMPLVMALEQHKEKKQQEEPPPTPKPQERNDYQAGLRDAKLMQQIEALTNKVEGLGQGRGVNFPAPARQQGSDVFLEVIGSLDKVAGLFNRQGNGAGGLTVKDILDLIGQAKNEGQSTAKDFMELAQKYAGDGSGVVEAKMVDILGDMVESHRREKKYDQAATQVQKSGKQGAKMFVVIRDGIAQILQDKLGSVADTAAQTIRGARTVQELLSAIHQVVAYLAEQLVDEGGGGEVVDTDLDPEPGDTKQDDTPAGEAKPD